MTRLRTTLSKFPGWWESSLTLDLNSRLAEHLEAHRSGGAAERQAQTAADFTQFEIVKDRLRQPHVVVAFASSMSTGIGWLPDGCPMTRFAKI
jgi:hypothetical protein